MNLSSGSYTNAGNTDFQSCVNMCSTYSNAKAPTRKCMGLNYNEATMECDLYTNYGSVVADTTKPFEAATLQS